MLIFRVIQLESIYMLQCSDNTSALTGLDRHCPTVFPHQLSQCFATLLWLREVTVVMTSQPYWSPDGSYIGMVF